MPIVVPSTLYRVVKSDRAEQRDFESNYARGRPMPRSDEPVMLGSYFGISTFASLEALRSRLKWAEFAAELQLPDGIPIAKTFGPWHWTIWARPEVLIETVAQVVRL